MIQTIKELRCKRANALLATSLYHIRPHMAGNEGRHGATLWSGKKKARSKGSNRVAVGSNRVAMNPIFAESYRAYSR